MSSHRRSMWRRRVLVLVSMLVVAGFAVSAWLLRPHQVRVHTVTKGPSAPDPTLAGEHRVAAESQPLVDPPTNLHERSAPLSPSRAADRTARRAADPAAHRVRAAPRRAVTAVPTLRRHTTTSGPHHTRAGHHEKAHPRHPTKPATPVRHVTPTRHHHTVRHSWPHGAGHHGTFHTTRHRGHGWGSHGRGHHRQRTTHWRHHHRH